MDDLRETLSRIARVESVPHAGYVRVFAIPGDCDAIAAAISIAAASGRLTSHNGTLDLGDDLRGEPSAIVRDANLDEAFAVGLGDNAFAFGMAPQSAQDAAREAFIAEANPRESDDPVRAKFEGAMDAFGTHLAKQTLVRANPLWRIDEHLSEPAYPDTLDAAKWADAFVSANFVMLITGSTRRGTFDEKLIEWFRAAIGAGYKAARPLEPDVFYASDGTTIAGADLREAVAHIKRGEMKLVDPIMPEISERDCSFMANDAAGEGVGVAGGKPE